MPDERQIIRVHDAWFDNKIILTGREIATNYTPHGLMNLIMMRVKQRHIEALHELEKQLDSEFYKEMENYWNFVWIGRDPGEDSPFNRMVHEIQMRVEEIPDGD